MEHAMKVNGKTICSMAKELKVGQIVLSMRETMPLEGSTEWELTCGMTVLSTQDNGRRIRYQG
jgi:hypothetical protein